MTRRRPRSRDYLRSLPCEAAYYRRPRRHHRRRAVGHRADVDLAPEELAHRGVLEHAHTVHEHARARQGRDVRVVVRVADRRGRRVRGVPPRAHPLARVSVALDEVAAMRDAAVDVTLAPLRARHAPRAVTVVDEPRVVGLRPVPDVLFRAVAVSRRGGADLVFGSPVQARALGVRVGAIHLGLEARDRARGRSGQPSGQEKGPHA